MLFLRIIFSSVLICLLQVSYAQPEKKTIIKLDNPSFEGPPNAGSIGRMYIPQWYDCGKFMFPKESAPDLQPGFFLVDLQAQDGDTYLGMVTRDNDSYESITQPLFKPLKAGTCYNFSLHLAVSSKYRSPARRSGILIEEAEANGAEVDSISHTDPILLRIWGSTNQCDRTQLLGETDKIVNKSWKKFDFRFEPKQNYRYIILEASYKKPALFTPNGHLLIDNLSEIVGMPCNLEPPLVDIIKPSKSASTKETKYLVQANLQHVYSKEDIRLSLNDKVFTDFKFDVASGDLSANIPLRSGNNKLQIKASNSEGEDSAISIVKRIKDQEIVAAVTPPKPDKITISKPSTEDDTTLEGVKKDDLKKNQKLEIKNISFKADSINVESVYEGALNKIATFLKSNNDVIIEIGGHTNNRCDDEVCNRLSESRAKSVMTYLVKNGVSENQLRSKGYGSTQPVASNNSSYGRRRNQRVEIKILEIKG